MYGIIGVAVATGIVGIQIIKRKNIKDIDWFAYRNSGKTPRQCQILDRRNIFGLGWALVGSCPGPIFILIWSRIYACNYSAYWSADWDCYLWALKNKLPH